MKFVADVMLGRLARWLRILGYDTTYDSHADDNSLIRIARAEDRVLLTRDTALSRRRGPRTLFILSQDVVEQVEQVIAALQLDPSAAFSRCPLCNVPVDPIDREAARAHVPPYVFHTQPGFTRCPQCGRIYWRGTHWAAMRAQLEDWGDDP